MHKNKFDFLNRYFLNDAVNMTYLNKNSIFY